RARAPSWWRCCAASWDPPQRVDQLIGVAVERVLVRAGDDAGSEPGAVGGEALDHAGERGGVGRAAQQARAYVPDRGTTPAARSERREGTVEALVRTDGAEEEEHESEVAEPAALRRDRCAGRRRGQVAGDEARMEDREDGDRAEPEGAQLVRLLRSVRDEQV